MNPQSSEKPNPSELNQVEQAPEITPAGASEIAEPEKIAEPYTVQHQAPVPQASFPTGPAATQVALPVDPVVQDGPALSHPMPAATLPADDVDLIEKTWVDKAKKIITDSKDDPYTQKKEISKVKAEYMESRFKKKIKLSDDNIK